MSMWTALVTTDLVQTRNEEYNWFSEVFTTDKFPSLDDKPNVPTFSRWVEISQEDDETFFDFKEIGPEDADVVNLANQINKASPPAGQPEMPEGSSSRYADTHRRIKFICPQHPTLIQGDVDAQNIFPYSRRPKTFIASVAAVPASYSRAIAGSKSSLWIDAIHKELDAMKRLEVWDVIPLKDDLKTPSLPASSYRILDEDVYLSMPQGLPVCRKSHCLKLKKDIYGLRQAPLAWYKRLTAWLICSGFTASVSDPCMFFQKTTPPIWLFFHIDDITFFRSELSSFKEDIKYKFDIKDLGKADLMLGIKLNHVDDGLIISQTHYFESVLALYDMSYCRPVATPMVPNSHLKDSSLEEFSASKALNANYRSAIGSLSYLSVATRPDISFAVSSLSEKPGIEHWNAFLHVL
ncbi:hypothetical protein O181_082131 [Austropuccinia psidii MF-1]|uniref:Reverse transcriptase Ty1/copia-type domain-containing protein n=1 Tax=Austropuccinia psidii MF-1 TaxID=1389203 RepID=A0A9Q3FLI8_9BASI|nr:hypothetical protein [Austropuccinia psidii MF-1]